jgi:hypothetical protein
MPIMSSFVRPTRHVASLIFGSVLCAAALSAQEGRHAPLPPSPFKYDLVLSGGHVLDAKNHRDAIMDVAVTAKIVCQLTVRGGKVVYDLNGISSDLWNGPPTSDYKLARYWTTMTTRDENKSAKSANAATSH